MAKLGRPRKGEVREKYDELEELIEQIRSVCDEIKSYGKKLSEVTFKEPPKPDSKISKKWPVEYDEARLRLKRSGADLSKIKLICHSVDRAG